MPAKCSSWQRAQAALKSIWGYDDFRPPQGDIIQGLLHGTDTLVVMPTGGGKSLCFQVPALLQRGLTVVVSPLVALMENQVRELQRKQLPAELLHGECTKQHRWQVLRQIDHHRLRLLYLSPETLLSPQLWQHLCQPHVHINGVIVDEAHCLVQWGDTFRPAYRRLGLVRETLLKTQPNGEPIAIAAFTATADPSAQAIIRSVLNLQDPKIVLINPYRDNLRLKMRTVWTPRGRRSHLLNWARAHSQQSGLVYVRTRREAERLAQWLMAQGYPAAAYHGGLGASARRQIEADWLSGTMPCVVCTSAFGMGIDQPNCRWVVQFQAPTLLSEYVQEVGRAGRDGKAAIALTLISEPTGWLDPHDRHHHEFIHNQHRKSWQQARALIAQLPKQGNIQTIQRQFRHGAATLSLLHSAGQLTWRDPFHYEIHRKTSLKAPKLSRGMVQMRSFLYTRQCRWQFILRAFGFEQDADALGKGCGTCDRCRA